MFVNFRSYKHFNFNNFCWLLRKRIRELQNRLEPKTGKNILLCWPSWIIDMISSSLISILWPIACSSFFGLVELSHWQKSYLDPHRVLFPFTIFYIKVIGIHQVYFMAKHNQKGQSTSKEQGNMQLCTKGVLCQTLKECNN